MSVVVTCGEMKLVLNAFTERAFTSAKNYQVFLEYAKIVGIIFRLHQGYIIEKLPSLLICLCFCLGISL